MRLIASKVAKTALIAGIMESGRCSQMDCNSSLNTTRGGMKHMSYGADIEPIGERLVSKGMRGKVERGIHLIAEKLRNCGAMLAVYAFPAEHWRRIHTINPIESTFATVRHLVENIKGYLSSKTGLAMAFKLIILAQAKWPKLNGTNYMPEIIQDVEFINEVNVRTEPPDQAATNFWARLIGSFISISHSQRHTSNKHILEKI